MTTRSEVWRNTARNVRTRAFVERYGRPNLVKPAAIMRHLVTTVVRTVRRGDWTPPFRPDEFFRYFNVIETSTDPALTSAAQLRKAGDAFRIVVNDASATGRHNFSVFHELAHVFFETALREKPRRLTQRELAELQATRVDEERLCDLAAAEFLLPKRAFRTRLTEFSGAWAEIYELARLFDASFEATTLRIHELWSGDLWVQKWSIADDRITARDLCCTGSFKTLRAAFAKRILPEIDGAVRRRIAGAVTYTVPAVTEPKRVNLDVRPWQRSSALSVWTIGGHS